MGVKVCVQTMMGQQISICIHYPVSHTFVKPICIYFRKACLSVKPSAVGNADVYHEESILHSVLQIIPFQMQYNFACFHKEKSQLVLPPFWSLC